MKSTFHAAKLHSSRIQRVFKALRKRSMTTLELGKACCSTRPASDASEANHALKRAGLTARIECAYEGMVNGRKRYKYTLCA